MTWQEGVAIGLVCVGLVAGGYLAAQRPAFWLEFATRILAALLPSITRYISKRNPPEIERAMRDCYRRGGTWNNFTKRCE